MKNSPKNNSRKELESLLENLEKRTGKKYFHWVKDYWTTRGESLDFVDHGYLTRIYEDQHPEIVYKKSAQAGLTERMVTEAIWLPDNFKENSLYLFPTSGTVSDLVQERVDDPINNNSYLSAVSGRAKRIMGKQADKVNMKRMSKGFVYFRGSNKATQITSVPADIVFVDELDRMVVENIPYFDKRLEHSNRKWMRWASTPTIPGYGIDAKYEDSDKHEYHVKCNHCSDWQSLTFWDNVNVKEGTIVCRRCKKSIIPYRLKGEWRSTNPGHHIRGYYINQLYSSRLDINKLIRDSQKTAEWEVQQFYNQNLGLAYEPKGSKITEEDFDAATRDYLIPFKPEGGTFMGVDVGKVLHVVIMSKNRLCFVGEVKHFEELDGLVKEYNVKVGVIDALPETRKASEFAGRFRGRIYLCYYTGVKEIKDGEWFKKEPQKVNTDRTMSLDKSTDIIKKQNLELPKNLSGYPDFKTHCKNIIRVVSEDRGNIKAEYMKVGPDHFRHSLNYANIAKEIYSNTPVFGVMSM